MEPGQHPNGDNILKNVKEIEACLESAKSAGAIARSSRECVAVVGGLGSFESIEAASAWLKERLWGLWGPRPEDVYAKGELLSVIFAKFGSKRDRGTAVVLLRRAAFKERGHPLWAEPGQPFEIRVRSLPVMGTKQIMTAQWGYDRKALWADPESGSQWLGNEAVILTTEVRDKTLHVECEPGWIE